jgi:hypothetical protein
MKTRTLILLTTVITLLSVNSAFAEESISELKGQIASLRAQMDSHTAERAQTGIDKSV